MPYTKEFCSINEINKPVEKRVHHNNSACGPGREIPGKEKKFGTGGYCLCEDCEKVNKEKR